jgi:hypothetical protein
LQQFVGILENFPHPVALCTQRLCGQLRGHLDSRHAAVFGHETYFVDPYGGLARQRRFQLLRKQTGFCVSAWKSANKTRELRLRQTR